MKGKNVNSVSAFSSDYSAYLYILNMSVLHNVIGWCLYSQCINNKSLSSSYNNKTRANCVNNVGTVAWKWTRDKYIANEGQREMWMCLEIQPPSMLYEEYRQCIWARAHTCVCVCLCVCFQPAWRPHGCLDLISSGSRSDAAVLHRTVQNRFLEAPIVHIHVHGHPSFFFTNRALEPLYGCEL